jgi:hypothetical protein
LTRVNAARFPDFAGSAALTAQYAVNAARPPDFEALAALTGDSGRFLDARRSPTPAHQAHLQKRSTKRHESVPSP